MRACRSSSSACPVIVERREGLLVIVERVERLPANVERLEP